jgi:hypothetical protein
MGVKIMAEEIKLTKTEQRVFDYMSEFGFITSLQAFTDLGNSRLSATIFNLKKKGVVIGGSTMKVQNRFGENRYVKKYWIG